MPIERSAGAIVFRREPQSGTSSLRGKKGNINYLLLHYQSGHWDFPKGNIEKGETLKETAEREIREETGIRDVKFINGFKETIKYFYKLKGENIFKIVVFLLAETKTKEVQVSREHIGFKWLPYEEALNQLTFKNAKEILEKANEFLIRPET